MNVSNRSGTDAQLADVARRSYLAYVDKDRAANDRVYVTYIGRTDSGRWFQNTEVLTVRGAKIVEAQVYFGWSLPHPGFLRDT
jgi:hypothetical protein